MGRLALALGPDLRPPSLDKGLDLCSIVFGVESLGLAAEADEHRPHIGGNRLIDAEQVRQIEAAKAVGIPPCQKKCSHTPGLSGVASGDLQELLECGAFMIGHCHVIPPTIG
ncbi:hypothetical protein Brsp07_05250 [Brucella sp. NBRC 14130]